MTIIPEPHAGSRPLGRGAMCAALADAVVGRFADFTGRGPTRARAIISGEWIFVTLGDMLTRGEQQLVESDRADWVRATRKVFQDALCESLVADVEAITGQKVVAFMSDNHIAPDVAIEAFLLDGEPATDA